MNALACALFSYSKQDRLLSSVQRVIASTVPHTRIFAMSYNSSSVRVSLRATCDGSLQIHESGVVLYIRAKKTDPDSHCGNRDPVIILWHPVEQGSSSELSKFYVPGLSVPYGF